MSSRFLLAFSLFVVLRAQPVKAASSAFSREVAFHLLKTPPIGGAPSLSPGRRWLAFSNRTSKPSGLVFYNTQTGSSWLDSLGGTPITWSDSEHLLSRTATQWRVSNPINRKSHSILSQPMAQVAGITYSQPFGVADWSPHSHRLAIVNGDSDLRFWNGRQGTWTRALDWGAVLKFPDWYRGEVDPSDLTWSRDGRLLAIRFYGRAERAPDSALHTVVFNVRGQRLTDLWGEDTGSVSWLDDKRLMFKGDDGGLGRAADVDLVVAEPRTKRRRVWKSKVIEWALSPRRDFVCALLSNGDLVRSSTRRPQWQLLQRRAISQQLLKAEDSWSSTLRLTISPRGDMVSLAHLPGGRGIWLFSTLPRKRWTIAWQAPRQGVNVVGWTPGHSLPLVTWGPENGPLHLAQLQKRPAS